MPRVARVAPGGLVYHVLNRAAGRARILRREADFEAFERVMIEAHRRFPLRLCAWCILPNHWHFVPWPERDGQLLEFFRWLAHTHAMRWRVAHHSVGDGPLYQGRFKSFPVEPDDEAFLIVCRYVERNALSAGLVRRAQDWRHGSLWVRAHGSAELRAVLHNDWPVERPRNWMDRVNAKLTPREIERVRTSILRGRPLGEPRWVERTAARLDLMHTLRREGRPRKNASEN
jgi:putative transposase